MSLSLRLMLSLAVMLAAMVLLAGTALWGLHGLDHNLGASLNQHERLRGIYEAGLEIVRARAVLRTDPTAGNEAWQRTVAAELKLAALTAGDSPAASTQATEFERLVDRARTRLQTAASHLPGTAPTTAEGGPAADVAREELTGALSAIAALASTTRQQIAAIETAATRQQRTATVVMTIVAAGAGGLALIVGLLQYRAVMRPLRRLERGVRRIGSGRFDERLEPRGDREFAQVAEAFNRMAGELASLYGDLEGKVRSQSRELARSERLASVGFLAAGVAHEINNPLAIIAGEAELAQRRQARGTGRDADADEALRVIYEEALRCKQISEKLLGLARSGRMETEPVPLAALVEEVAAFARSLPQSDGRRLTSDFNAMAHLTAHGDRLQVRQVLLNLVINALEATEPGAGEVVVRGEMAEGGVRVVVIDNGRGMDEATLDRVFEPFFTAKRGSGEPGTGLGLSISHAIVQRLGGRLWAASAGPGRGSRFVIELPAAVQQGAALEVADVHLGA